MSARWIEGLFRSSGGMRWGAVLGASILVGVLVSCGPLDLRQSVQQGNCRGGPARPLAVREVIHAFRANGFTVSPLTKHDLCDRSIAYVVTNANYELPSDVYKRIEETQGALTCWVSPASLYGAKPLTNLHAPAYSPMYHGRKAELSFENLKCVLHASNSHPDQQVARFVHAARQLGRRKQR
jgi:hypothetical protein